MKGLIIAAVAAGLLTGGAFAADASVKKEELTSPQQKASYSIGVSIGKSLKAQRMNPDFDVLLKGIKDGNAGASALTDQEIQSALMMAQSDSLASIRKEGSDFLAGNKGKEGIKTTTSGLQYKVIKEGKGAKPKSTDTVKIHYRGTFIDGTEFDSSYKTGEPAEFNLSSPLIKGWVEGVQLMNVGSKYQFFIPADLAYGEQGNRGIPPNSTLIFEVELIDIVKAEAGAAPAPAK